MAQEYASPPESRAGIGVQPADTLAEAGRKVMGYHFAGMLSHEPGTRLGEDIEALHDMRVATRRLRAAFEVFGQAFQRKAIKPHLKGLRTTGRALGAVRDLDVFIENARAYLETLPEDKRHGLEPLLQAWGEQREHARTQMLAYLDSQEYQKFKQKFAEFVNSPGAGVRQSPPNPPAPQLVRDLAPLLIYTRLASVCSFDPHIDNASIELLHALRIEVKKLRYTVEYFRDVLSPKANSVIEELKGLQDHLGSLNDAQVATSILREFMDNWEPHQAALPISERQDLEASVSYLAYRHAERHRLLVSFPGVWRHFMRPQLRRNLALALSVL